MATTEKRHRGDMRLLWAVTAALLSASLSCVTFFARFALVFADQLRWLDAYLQCVSYLALAAAPVLILLGVWAARKAKGGPKQSDPAH